MTVTRYMFCNFLQIYTFFSIKKFYERFFNFCVFLDYAIFIFFRLLDAILPYLQNPDSNSTH